MDDRLKAMARSRGAARQAEGWSTVAAHDFSDAPLRIFDAIERLAVGVGAPPIAPTLEAIRWRDLRIQIEPITMHEAQVALGKHFEARPAPAEHSRAEHSGA